MFTSLCLCLAAWLLRRDHREWALAMRAELPHLADNQERLHWAFGCLAAAIKQRVTPMVNGTLRIARWVMLIETIGLFGPLTLAWFEFTFGASGIVRLNAEIIEKVFLNQPGGTYTLILWYAVTVTGLIGAFGLFLGLRYVVLGRALGSRALGITMIAILMIPTILGTLVNLFMGPVGPAPNLGIFIMFVAAPIAGFAHLLYLAKPGGPAPAAAAVA